MLIKWVCYSGTLSPYPAQQTKIVGQCASHHRSQCKSGATQTLSLISEVQGGSRIFFPVSNLISCSRIRIYLNGMYLIHNSRYSSFPVIPVPPSFPGDSVVKNLPANTGGVVSVPGLGRSPGEGSGSPLQYSCQDTPWTEDPGRLQSMGLHKSGAQLSD